MTTTYMLTLECGCHRTYHDDGSRPPQIGWYYACVYHSPIVGYDPDRGHPKHERDQRVMTVQEEQ